MLKNRKGFTLIELLVVMFIFLVVIMITNDSFVTILNQMAKITKSEESNIEGMVGLEMFRHDIQQIGFGLPTSYLSPAPTYTEAAAPANAYNDAPTGVPRAVVAGNDLGTTSSSDGTITYNTLTGADYLALKATSLGMNDTSKKWTYMPYSSGAGGKLKPHIWPSENLTHGQDLAIVIRRAFTGSEYVNQMVYNVSNPADTTIYWARYYSDGFADAAFDPTLPQDIFYIYGIKADPANGLGMPFNRSDYFVATPASASKMPAFCSPSTGILYKGNVTHSTVNTGGRLNYIPLLDCVADMQVVFGWDLVDDTGNSGQDGLIDTYSTPGGITVAGSASQATVQSALADPEQIRKSLKIIKVYLLAQVGRRDPGYTYTSTEAGLAADQIRVGDAQDMGISKVYTLTSAMRNYRWKLYRIAVRPKNLQTK